MIYYKGTFLLVLMGLSINIKVDAMIDGQNNQPPRRTWENSLNLKARITAINKIGISRDDSLVACAADDKSLMMCDAQSGKVLQTLNHDDQILRHIRFSDDKKTVVASGRVVKIWDIESGMCVCTVNFSNYSNFGAISSDNNYLYSVECNELRIFDLRTKHCMFKQDPHIFAKMILCNQYPTIFDLACYDEKAKAYENKLKCLITTVINKEIKNPLPVTMNALQGIVATPEGIIKRWDIGSCKQLSSIKASGEVSAISVSASNKMIVAGLKNGLLQVWRASPNNTHQIQEKSKDVESLDSLKMFFASTSNK